MSNATNLDGLDALLNGGDAGFDSLANNTAYYTPMDAVQAVQDVGVSLANMVGLSKLIYDENDGGALPDIGTSVFVNGAEYLVIDKESDSSGYQGLALFDQDLKSIIVVNRGTEPASLKDWAADAQMALTTTSNQWPDALALGQRVADYAAANGISAIYTTGHSLGGTLTEMQAAYFGWQGYTFNAYGANEIYAQLGLTVSSSAQITNYRTLFDLVSDASTHIGDTPITIETPQDVALLGSFFDVLDPTQSLALDVLATVG